MMIASQDRGSQERKVLVRCYPLRANTSGKAVGDRVTDASTCAEARCWRHRAPGSSYR
jgi:hypothetical protein